MTALLLLAAGRSKRFGVADKLMAGWKGRPLCAHVGDTVSDGWAGDRLAIVSNPEVRSVLEGRGWRCVVNADPCAGQAGSLIRGIQELTGQDVVIALADMPFVPAAHVRAVADALAGSDAVMSRADGITLPPAAFRAACQPALLALTGDRGARHVFETVPRRTVVDLPQGAARDIDSPADLAGFPA